MNAIQLVSGCILSASVMASWPASAAYSLSPYQNFVTKSWADAAAVGDVDGDGRDDVVLTTTFRFDEVNDYKVLVYFQRPDGTLAAPRKYSYPGAITTGLAMADLDRDGRMDIVVGHTTGISIFRWGHIRGGMGMSSRVYAGGYRNDDVAILDVNRDGALDVVDQTYADGAIIFLGDGRGGVSRQVELATPLAGENDIEAGDFNGDGYQDIALLSGQGVTRAYVYYNDGSDDFSRPLEIKPTPRNVILPRALASGDFNADGRDDLIIGHNRTDVALYLQNASGVLLPPLIVPSAMDPTAMVGRDLDLDGRSDLVVLHSGGEGGEGIPAGGALGIYLQGMTGLEPEMVMDNAYGSWFNTQDLAVGDVNGDNCPDIVTANYNYGLVVNAGNGCNPVADLAASLGLTSSIVALRLDNFGAATAATPDAVVDVSLRNANLTVGTLPAGCTALSQTASSARLQCTSASLDAGTSHTLMLPIGITGGDGRYALAATARASTTSLELHLGNNTAHGLLRGSSLTAAPIPPGSQSLPSPWHRRLANGASPAGSGKSIDAMNPVAWIAVCHSCRSGRRSFVVDNNQT